MKYISLDIHKMHKLFLFKVEDHFQITNQGLIAMPGISLNTYEGVGEINLLLKKPNGDQSEETAEIFYSYLVPTPDKKMLTILFPKLNKEDVPIGTEIWFISGINKSKQKYVDTMSILIAKNLDETNYVDYEFSCSTWIKDPRYRTRNFMIGDTKGLFRIKKDTLEAELLLAMEGDISKKIFFNAVTKIITEYKLTNSFPKDAHFAAG